MPRQFDFNRDAAEREADQVGVQFMDSNDVIGDMSSQYGVDFSGVQIHDDSAANARAKSLGKDAVATGNDIYFAEGAFNMEDPASRGLLAHELTHTMQQGAVEGGNVEQSAPMGEEQGGILDWFKGFFGKLFGKGKKKNAAQPAATRTTAPPVAPPSVAQPFDEEASFERLRTTGIEGVRDSNASFTNALTPEGTIEKSDASNSLTGLGVRDNSKDQSKAMKPIEEEIFGDKFHSGDMGEIFSQPGTDWAQVKSGITVDQKGMTTGGSVSAAKNVTGTEVYAGAILDKVLQRLNTPLGRRYIGEFAATYSGALAFTSGNVDFIPFMLQAIINRNGGITSRTNGAINREGNADLTYVLRESGRAALGMCTVAKMTDQERSAMPQSTQDLYTAHFLPLVDFVRQTIQNHNNAPQQETQTGTGAQPPVEQVEDDSWSLSMLEQRIQASEGRGQTAPTFIETAKAWLQNGRPQVEQYDPETASDDQVAAMTCYYVWKFEREGNTDSPMYSIFRLQYTSILRKYDLID